MENQTDLQLPSELWLEVMAYSEPIALIRGLYCVNKLFHDIARRILDLQLVQFTREFEGRIKGMTETSHYHEYNIYNSIQIIR